METVISKNAKNVSGHKLQNGDVKIQKFRFMSVKEPKDQNVRLTLQKSNVVAGLSSLKKIKLIVK